MQSEFDKLSIVLNLDSANPSKEALLSLRNWYFEQVSQDKSSKIDVNTVRDYLEIFLPNLPENTAESVSAFQQMNSVQYAAYKGYDRFLDNLDVAKNDIINKAFQNDMTPLHLAAMNGHVHAVKALLEHGADPYKKNLMGQYPIKSALFVPMIPDEDFYKQKTIIFNLLKSAAPDTIYANDNRGETVAHEMAMGGYTELICDLIHENSSMILMADRMMKYPIHYAILNEKLDVVKLLLQMEGVTQLMDTNGRVALHYAARASDSAMIEACLPYYMDIDLRDLTNKTALMYAAESGNLPAMIALINQKADIHAKDSFGLSLLHHAVNSGSENLVTWALDNLSLDINEKDVSGHTALFYAKQNGLNEIVAILVNRGALDNIISPRF